MPFPRPTLSQLLSSAQSDFGIASLLRFSNLKVLAKVIAYGFNGLYGYLDYIAQQAVPFTATDEYLEGWAAIKSVFRKAATPAGGVFTTTGTNGTPCPSGTPVNRADGFAYVTTAAGTWNGGVLTAPIQATTSGSNGNAPLGVGLSLGTAIAGITAAGSAATALTGGSDVELDAQLKTRMLLAFSETAQGGDLTDYEEWTLAAAGVTRAWIAPQGMGPGTVVCYFMMDSSEAAHSGFPQGSNGVAAGETRDVTATGDQLTVANAVFANCNVNALVYAVAPVPNTINLTISGLTNAPGSVQTAISAALTALFLSEGSVGGSRLAGAVTGGTIDISEIEAAIGALPGTTGFAITALTASAGGGSPTTNITSNTGALPVLGSITYV